MALRDAFRVSLGLLAKAIASLEKRGIAPPVLVGGAAVEIHTHGVVTTGDFDVVTAARSDLFDALLSLGFVRPTGTGALTWGLVHPASRMSVQVVVGQLMDGKTERDRLLVLDLGEGRVPLIPIEDLIADRMGQAY